MTMKLKKVLLPFIAGALALSLAACGNDDKAEKDEPKKEPAQETAQEPTKEEKAAMEEMNSKLAEQQVEEDKVVATVNEEELTGVTYNSALSSIQAQMQQSGQDPTSEEAKEQVKTQALDMLVNQTLILQKAEEADIQATESEINEEYKTFEDQYGGEKEMKKELKEISMDEKTFKSLIAESIIIGKYEEKIAPVGKVSDKEVKDYYDKIAAESKDSGQELPAFEEVSAEIQGGLEQEQRKKVLLAHVEELKEAAKIELKL